MRFLALLVGLLAAFGGSYGAFAAVQAVGPEDATDNFGYGDAATVSPNGGDLLESANFALVIDGLKRELGPQGRVSYLRLERTEAQVTAYVDGLNRNIEFDASGRWRVTGDSKASLTARMLVSRFDVAAIDRIVEEARKQAGAPVENLTFSSNGREWNIDMADGGEPDSFIANLDGSGLRLSGEPNPVGIGAAPDSLLREQNLAQVIAAARKQAPADARLTGFDIRPDRVSFELATGGRELSLDYAYDAQLTSRRLAARTGVDRGSIGWEQLDPSAPERMARTATKLLQRDLADVNYVLLSMPTFEGEQPGLSMYFREGAEPPYAVADLRGRRFSWPGRD
jgi:hypothetical protein